MRCVIAWIMFLGLSAAVLATGAKECLDVSASRDTDTESPSGVRVTVAARNHCQESIDSGRVSFRVKAMDRVNVVVASQRGRFGPMVEPRGHVETKVFVVCDPAKVYAVSVETE